jgi:sigma-B regulation protein RsbU (phosphoserine phosphatase)
MSNFQAALRILVRQHLSLKKIIHELNHLVWLNTQGESFATAFFMEYDFKTKQMTYVNAGHNPPLLFQNYLLQELKEGTTILGSFKELPFVQITEINHIDSFFLFCFTDGFTETVNEQGDEFGSEQLAAFIEAHKQLDQQELHKELIKVLYQYKGKNEYIDDITLLSCGVKNN